MTVLQKSRQSPGAREDAPLPVKIKLAALWTSTMFLYAYADIQHFVLQPGSLQDIQQGTLEGITLGQPFLLGAAALMTIPALMIVLSVVLRAAIVRPLNLLVGGAFTLITLGTVVMPGETWWFYWLFNLVEMILTISIVVLAWSWPPTSPDSTTR